MQGPRTHLKETASWTWRRKPKGRRSAHEAKEEADRLAVDVPSKEVSHDNAEAAASAEPSNTAEPTPTPTTPAAEPEEPYREPEHEPEDPAALAATPAKALPQAR